MPSSIISKKKAPIAVTLGDPAGVGPLLLEAANTAAQQRCLPTFQLIADQTLIKTPVVPGVPNSKNARAVIQSINTAVDRAMAGKVSAVVTCPIHKKTLLEARFKHAGHTTYLGELTKSRPVMMLANEHLKVVPVTGHIPLKDVPRKLNTNLIIETAKIVADDLARKFGIANPRMAITGLNPHAGEDGALGSEEHKIIHPAILTLQELGYQAEGPFPADTAFVEAMRMKFDVFLAMTHDQALIPIKTLDYRKAVNITLGLPIVRTSPAHGTAFDLMREGRAPDPESFIQALLWADQLTSS